MRESPPLPPPIFLHSFEDPPPQPQRAANCKFPNGLLTVSAVSYMCAFEIEQRGFRVRSESPVLICTSLWPSFALQIKPKQINPSDSPVYSGVPKISRTSVLSSMCRDRPKSTILMSPSGWALVSRMFWGWNRHNTQNMRGSIKTRPHGTTRTDRPTFVRVSEFNPRCGFNSPACMELQQTWWTGMSN